MMSPTHCNAAIGVAHTVVANLATATNLSNPLKQRGDSVPVLSPFVFDAFQFHLQLLHCLLLLVLSLIHISDPRD